MTRLQIIKNAEQRRMESLSRGGVGIFKMIPGFEPLGGQYGPWLVLLLLAAILFIGLSYEFRGVAYHMVW